jgi:cell division protein FtsQ
VFISGKDIEEVLKTNNVAKGIEVDSIHPALVEGELKKNAWIKDVQLFFDNNQLLTVRITERQPVARIFTASGNSFYIDSGGNKLPLSEKFSARVPVFTSYPGDKKMSAADSAAAEGVKRIAQFIQQDSFWMAQVAQVDITPAHTYEIIPVLGNQVVKFGDAENIAAKFGRLLAFYKQVWSKTGFEKYSVIDVQYQGQVVAVRRGEEVARPDSVAAMQQYAAGLANMRKVVHDSLYAAVEPASTGVKRDSTTTVHAVSPAKSNSGKKAVAGNKQHAAQSAKGSKAKKKPKRH